MNNEKEMIDWERLKKALLVEAGRGFQNIQGKQYIFNDFLSISLSKPPVSLKAHQNKFQDFSILKITNLSSQLKLGHLILDLDFF